MKAKKHLLFFLFFLITGVSLSTAQELKNLTLENLTPGAKTYLSVENLYNIQWWGDFYAIPNNDSLCIYNPKKEKKEFVIRRDSLNKYLPKEGTLTSMYSVSLPWSAEQHLLIQKKNLFFIYDWAKNKLINKIEIKGKAQNIDFHSLSKNVAYTIDNNLYVNNMRVTLEPEGVVCGKSVHQQEFGINKGTFWSPGGRLLAFYKMDERMVDQYPYTELKKSTTTTQSIHYPMAGEKSHKVSVGVYNVYEDSFIYLNTGDPTDRYFTNISWAPDEKSVFLIELNREQNLAKLCQYNVQTGNLMKVLFEESHPKYVEPQNPITFIPWATDHFIYQSEKDGFNHLYMYNTEGELIQQITKGEWLVTKLIGFNTKQKEIIYSSTESSPLENHLYAINAKGEKRLLNEAEGVHSAILSPSGEYIIDRYSNPNTPRKTECYSTINPKEKQTIHQSDNPYKEYQLPIIEVDTLLAADNKTTLYYRMVKPANFDPNKKYPTIIYVYGGPHAQLITKDWLWGTRGWDIYMANKGYIVFTLDNRGSSNRGLAFENSTYKQLGVIETMDQMKGVEWLKTQPYVDAERLGVHGWSFGGHMTLSLLLKHPGVFKVGVSGGPVVDWKFYEIMYGERYMSSPKTNAEGYELTDMKKYAGKLKDQLLIIHGGMDNICVPQHTFSFINACIEAGTQPDLFIYPNHGHNVIGKDRVHLLEKITRYFDDFL